MQTLIIDGRLPGMNEIIAMSKSHFAVYAKSKKQYTDMIAWECKAYKIAPMDKQVNFTFRHYCKDKRRDKDNITTGAQKYIFDGLQKAGVIKNDGWSEIGNISHEFYISKNERIEIIMEETK